MYRTMKAHGVTEVTMESTAVYWIPIWRSITGAVLRDHGVGSSDYFHHYNFWMIKGSEKMITFSDPLISKYYFDTQNINLKNDHKRSAMPLCKAKNRPHDIRKMITRTDPMIRILQVRSFELSKYISRRKADFVSGMIAACYVVYCGEAVVVNASVQTRQEIMSVIEQLNPGAPF